MSGAEATKSRQEGTGRLVAEILRKRLTDRERCEELCDAALWWVEKECDHTYAKLQLWRTGRSIESFIGEVMGQLVMKMHKQGWGEASTETGCRQRLAGFIGNSIRDALKPEAKWRRQNMLSQDGAAKGRIAAEEGQMRSASEWFIATDEARARRMAIEDCIRRLRKRHWQEVAILRYEEMTIIQIAAKMKATVDAVDCWWRRTKKHLRSCLQRKLGGSGL